MKSKPRIVVVGSLVFDFVAVADRLPQKGETLLGRRFGMFPGGKGANQAVQAGRLGADVHLVGRVGTDWLGEKLLASLHESNVNTERVRKDPKVNTAACCIHVDGEGGNSIIIVPEANAACSPADVDEVATLIQSADVLLCQLEVPISTVVRAVELAAKSRVNVILNPAPVQKLPAELLQLVDYLTPNESEADGLLGHSTGTPGSTEWISATASALLARGPRNVVLTLGDRGCFLASVREAFHAPAFKVMAVDTTAAGDAFNGALAVALAEGRAKPDALAFANAAGALAATRAGAQPSLPWRREIENLMQGTASPRSASRGTSSLQAP